MIDTHYRNEFFAATLEAALWADLWTTDGEDLADEYESVDALTLTALRQECDDFIDGNSELLAEYAALGNGPDQAGHDFHLTRNHHGAGFWDRGAGAVGDALTKASDPYGDYSLWVDEDGVVRAL